MVAKYIHESSSIDTKKDSEILLNDLLIQSLRCNITNRSDYNKKKTTICVTNKTTYVFISNVRPMVDQDPNIVRAGYVQSIYSRLTQVLSNISSYFPAIIDRLVIFTVSIGFEDRTPAKDGLFFFFSICRVLFGESI